MIFIEYMEALEKAIVDEMGRGMLGRTKKMVPARPGRLSLHPIATVLGDKIRTDKVLIIDYYEYMKKSIGFREEFKRTSRKLKGCQIKMIPAPVVHFNSVKLETIAKLAPYLVSDFSEFKKAVLDAREFRHNYK